MCQYACFQPDTVHANTPSTPELDITPVGREETADRIMILKNLTAKVFYRLPRRLIYPRIYFEAQSLMFRRDAGESVEPFLMERLAALLRDSLRYVPHYRALDLMDWRKITAENALDSLRQFPFLDKKEVMAASKDFVSERYRPDRLQAATSGGSTGEGIQIYTSYSQRLTERAFFDYQWAKQTGWRRSSPMARIGCDGKKKENEYPCSTFGDKLLISPYHVTERWLPVIISEIEARGIRYFHSYPSCFESLADYLAVSGRTLPRVKGIFLASEHVSPSLLEKIPSVCPNARVVFHYGMTERAALAWGRWTPPDVSYKFDALYGAAENFIHPDGAAEIVGTCFWNDQMPLIRYKTQDFGRIENGVMAALDGREQEFLVTKSGGRIPGFSISIGKFTWREVETFQVVQNEPGKVEFHASARNGRLSEEIKRAILADQTAKWGGLFDLSLVELDRIPRTSSGKLRLVVSNLNRSHASPPDSQPHQD